jgi:hypothetical protein
VQILQILPYLPPTITGVGDYGYLLAQQLRADHDINTRFLLCDPIWHGVRDLDGFIVDQLESRQMIEFQKKLNFCGTADAVLLHYVGYGYQKRGSPVWLVRGLQRWKARNRNCKLIVMFHELYAFGPPWRSSFWTSHLQRFLAKSLALLSNHCITNLQASMQALVQMTSRPLSHFSVLPVFSTIGEPKGSISFTKKSPRMAVFGSAGWRRQAYDAYGTVLDQACQKLGISEIIDIGPPCDAVPDLSTAWVAKGILSAEEVSRQLLNTRAGFFVYPARCLGKSSVFAAYAAHGLIPVTFSENIAGNDGLRPGEHFLPMLSTYDCDPNQMEIIGQNAHDWYRKHSIREHAGHYGKIIRGLASPHQCKNIPVVHVL